MVGACVTGNDVDGFCAIAVLPILLFHAGVTAPPSGLPGVDILFVILVFLITGIMVRDMDGKRFSLWRFYQRRAVRVFPALFVLLLAVVATGWLVMLPNELERAGVSAASAAAFVANIRF